MTGFGICRGKRLASRGTRASQNLSFCRRCSRKDAPELKPECSSKHPDAKRLRDTPLQSSCELLCRIKALGASSSSPLRIGLLNARIVCSTMACRPLRYSHDEIRFIYLVLSLQLKHLRGIGNDMGYVER